MEEDYSDVDMKEDNETSEIVRVGEGSAELITGTNPIGEGGKNTWESSEEEEEEEEEEAEEMDQDDSDEIQVIKVRKQDKTVLDNIGNDGLIN